MATFLKFNQFTEDLSKKVHNLGSDALKVLLTNTAPVATNAIKSDLTEITAQNGYSAGGNTPAITSCVQTSGVLKLILVTTVFTAAGGTIGPFRYVVLYNDTPTSPSKPLIAWWDYGSSITLNDTETFTVTFDSSNGVLTIT